MIQTVERRLRRSWHHFRRRMGSGHDRPMRLVIEKATWLEDARSPVTLMIDDLTNAWHNSAGGNRWEAGGDWGGGHNAPDSALQFLETRLLRDFPEARVTFFVVAGPISQYTHHQPFSYSAPLDTNDESRRFFTSLADDPRFELAYHGLNHGTPGDRSERFVQEWQGFTSHEEAVAQTKRGLATFARTVGRVPGGGKYGGWEYNTLAEGALDECGFLWWCRDWMPRDTTGRVPDAYYEPQFFGRRMIVALPSTVHGYFWESRQIDVLLAKRQVIAIEEHIAPVRPDGRVQTPNIVDDIDQLRRLYQYLRGKNVWHATCTEIASYVIAREHSVVYDVTRDSFSIRYSGRAERPRLTLRLSCPDLPAGTEDQVEVMTPAGERVTCRRSHAGPGTWLATVPVHDGRYQVRRLADAGTMADAGGEEDARRVWNQR